MNRWPSVSVTATAEAAAEGAADSAAALAAVDGAALAGAADGDEPLVHAAMNALNPARPVPARNPRRLTRDRFIRWIRASRSRSVIGCSPPLPGPPGRHHATS